MLTDSALSLTGDAEDTMFPQEDLDGSSATHICVQMYLSNEDVNSMFFNRLEKLFIICQVTSYEYSSSFSFFVLIFFVILLRSRY